MGRLHSERKKSFPNISRQMRQQIKKENPQNKKLAECSLVELCLEVGVLVGVRSGYWSYRRESIIENSLVVRRSWIVRLLLHLPSQGSLGY
jgi:hypothetical protein